MRLVAEPLAIDGDGRVEHVVPFGVARADDDRRNLRFDFFDPRSAVAANHRRALRIGALCEELARTKKVAVVARRLSLVGGLDASEARFVGGPRVRARQAEGGEDIDARVAREAWPRPALVALHGTWIGAIAAGSRRLEDLADALLYDAPAGELVTEAAPAGSFDRTYVSELDRRSWIEWGDSTRARRFLGIVGRE